MKTKRQIAFYVGSALFTAICVPLAMLQCGDGSLFARNATTLVSYAISFDENHNSITEYGSSDSVIYKSDTNDSLRLNSFQSC